MARGYHTLQHWNQWLSQASLGKALLEAEREMLTAMLSTHFGKHALLIGVPHQAALLHATRVSCHTLLSPMAPHQPQQRYIESGLQALPIYAGSIDLVFLPHTMEYLDNPRQLLSEACRVIKPEGLIVITGFNPNSLWGLKKRFSKEKKAPWSGNFIPAQEVVRWLKLADFEMEAHHATFRLSAAAAAFALSGQPYFAVSKMRGFR